MRDFDQCFCGKNKRVFEKTCFDCSQKLQDKSSMINLPDNAVDLIADAIYCRANRENLWNMTLDHIDIETMAEEIVEFLTIDDETK